jgi:hypothetical protein
MKHLLTLAALLVSTLSLAQQMPYNPDANGDDFVGVDDVLGVLGVYDTALMQPSLTCDYEGTDLEQLIAGLFEQTLVLDSVYVEYLLLDTVTTYLPGCPDPVDIETIIERSYTFISPSDLGFSTSTDWMRVRGFMGLLDYYRAIEIYFYPESGYYRINVQDNEVGTLTSYGETGSVWQTMPFPPSWSLNQDGINVDFDNNSWVANSESFRFIPFWHEAE